MTTRNEWIALAKRCQEAKGPDWEIDGDIAFLAKQFVGHLPRTPERPWLWAEFVGPDDWEIWEAPAYTASLDAITSLIEREFTPNYRLIRSCGGSDAVIYLIGGGYAEASATSACLALCAAFCLAKAEMGND